MNNLPEKENKIRFFNIPVGSIILFLIIFSMLVFGNYYTEDSVTIAGFGVYMYLPVAMILFVLACLAFLIKPNFARFLEIADMTGPILLMYVFPVVWSIVIWVVQGTETSAIRRGLVFSIYPLCGVLAMSGLVYFYGQKASVIYLWSMVIANLIVIANVAISGGIGEFIIEFIQLLTSFASNTGPLMMATEVQGITYAIGMYLIYFAMEKTEIKKNWLVILLMMLCFLMGLKRIAILAGIAAVAIAILFRKKNEKVVSFLIDFTSIAILIIALVYVYLIGNDFFSYLETIGVDTNNRDWIYSTWMPYFEFSPFFLGRGTGFCTNLYLETYNAAEVIDGWKQMELFNTHNDFLTSYIELGMWGYVIETCLRSFVQMKSSLKHLGTFGSAICTALTLYTLINGTTDNCAFFMIFLVESFSVILMSYHLDEREEKREEKLREANRRRSENIS